MPAVTPTDAQDALARTDVSRPQPTNRLPGGFEGWRGGIFVAALGLFVRLLHLVNWAHLPLFDRPTVDAAVYVEMAKRLAASFVWQNAFYKPPLYPYLLGLTWKLVGANYFLLRLPGIVCGALTCLVVWWIARRMFGARAGLLAGLFWALHRTAVYFEGELVEIGVATFLQAVALALVLRAGTRTARRRDALWAGLALGLGTIVRPTFLLFDIAALVWLGRRQAMPALLALGVALLPVTLHNAVRGHDFVLVASNLGVNYYLGNNPNADGRSAAADVLPANPLVAERSARDLAEAQAGRVLRASEVSWYWLQRGLQWDAQHFTSALGLLGRKIFYAWNAAEISDNEDLAGLGRHLRMYRFLPVGAWLLAPLGLAGLLLAPRRREVTLIRLYVVAQITSLLPFFIVARFRLPWMPGLVVLAAWMTFETVYRFRTAGPGRRTLLATLAATIAFCSVPAFGVRNPVDFDLDYKLGYAWQQKGDVAAALESYKQAVQRNPRNALAQNALGVLLASTGGDLDAAAAAVETALAVDPGRTADYAESLAGIELRRGDAKAALAACARGLAVDGEAPERAALYLRQAQAHRILGATPDEAAALRAALATGAAGSLADTAHGRLDSLDVMTRADSIPH